MLDNYEAFKTQVFQLTKIDLNSYKERQMKRRIDALISKRGAKSYEEYVEMLRKDSVVYEEFINYLTINVSEFWRNPEQWKALEEEILPRLFEKFGKNLKIWSAACSTGDEPYSLVMLFSKFMPLNQIRIIATDIDKQVLEKARMGLYNDKSIRGLPQELVNKCFTKIGQNSYQISEEIKKCVEFKQHNLLKDEYPMQCDLIVCRNVLIYFTEEAKEGIFRKFNHSLRTEGILFIGSTEQIMQPQSLGYKACKSFFYLKVN